MDVLGKILQNNNSMSEVKTSSRKSKAVKNKKLRLRRKKNEPEPIIIDASKGLIFKSEEELYSYFQPQVVQLEKEYQEFRTNTDLNEEDFSKNEELDLEPHLDKTLDEPGEIWHDEKTFSKFPIFHLIRTIENLSAYHVAVAYVSTNDEPTFILLHFLTRDLKLVEKFRRGDLVYDRIYEEVGFGAIEGDALTDGDSLSVGLFISMLKLRGESDIPHEKFQELGKLFREETIEHADEIWRSSDMNGRNVANFIKEFHDHEIPNLYYLACTLEDPSTQTHTLLFSFPTNDESLVDRYRRGDNLQAEEVAQESSH